MKTAVIIFQDLPQSDKPIQLIRFAADQGKHEISHYSSTNDLPDLTTAEQITVLIPGQQVTTHKIKIPRTNRTQLLKAIPFALEDKIAGNIDAQHFAVGDWDAEGQLTIAVMDKKLLRTWIDQLASQGITPHCILPDYYGLAVNHDNISLAQTEKSLLLRFDKSIGMAIDYSNAAELLPLIVNQQDIKTIHGFNIDDNLQKTLQDNCKDINISNEKTAPWDFETLASKPFTNLMQREFFTKPKRSSKLLSNKFFKSKHNPWLWAGIALAAWLGLWFFGHVFSMIYYKIRTHSVNNDISVIFKKSYPSATEILQPKLQLEKKLKQLESANRSSDFISLLSKVGAGLQANKAISLKSLKYQHKTVVIHVTAKQLSPLQNFSHALEQIPLTVQQNNLQTDTSAKKVTATYSISEAG